jgi:nucleoside phosphorylase
MESSAFLDVCKYMKVKALGIVKGVSDLGDDQKNDGDYHNALVNAANGIKAYLEDDNSCLEKRSRKGKPSVLWL